MNEKLILLTLLYLVQNTEPNEIKSITLCHALGYQEPNRIKAKLVLLLEHKIEELTMEERANG